jgi:hypothetical protein
MSLLRRIPPTEISIAAHTIWLNKSIAKTIALETVQIINQTYRRKFAFFNGKSSKSIVGGLFYLLGYRYNATKKQNELADQLGTTDVSIRVSYRKWLETFPDLFLDVIAKFAMIPSLRSFVLLDLKHTCSYQKTNMFAVTQKQPDYFFCYDFSK